jgi:Ca2+-binding RTX toxin-like protein
MALFFGSVGNDVANANTGVIQGFTGGTVAELQDATGDSFDISTGSNTIFAGPGNDTFYVVPFFGQAAVITDASSNFMHGGAGDDRFVFDSRITNINGIIVDGGSGTDTIAFNPTGQNAVFDFQQQTIQSIEVIDGGATKFILTFRASQVGNGQLSASLTINSAVNNGIVTFNMGSVTYFDMSQFTMVVDPNAANFPGVYYCIVANGTGTASTTVIGSTASDDISGGLGADNLYGGGGKDLLNGYGGIDILVGGLGNDTLYGGDGNDTLSELFTPVGSGDDTMDGGNGIDIIYAADGNDTVFGGTDAANNFADIGDGNDSYSGGAAVDVVIGGNGIDTISGNVGDDSLYGGADNDTIYGGTVNSTALGTGNAAEGIDLLSGGDGNDQLYGGSGNNLLVGDAGDDALFGQAGIDVIYGGAGDDTLNGGSGIDALYGGVGNDSFQIGGVGYGTTYIWDFQSAVGLSDRLLLATGATITGQFAASGNYYLNFSNGSQTVLVGVTNVFAEDIVANGF